MYYSSGVVNVPMQMSLAPHQRLAPPILPTTMSVMCNMQTSSIACHLGPPTVGRSLFFSILCYVFISLQAFFLGDIS